MAYDKTVLFQKKSISKQEFNDYRTTLDTKFPRNPQDPSSTAPSCIAETKVREKGKLELADKIKKEFGPRWLQRMAAYDYFMNNFEALVKGTTIVLYNQVKETHLYAALEFNALSTTSPKIKEVRVDGGEYTSSLENPLMVIAGNTKAGPGSAYRAFAIDKKTNLPKGVGDAQEEKTSQTLCGGLVIAAIEGKKITEEGDFEYNSKTAMALDKRAALVATDLFHGEKLSSYGLVISCAPAMNDENSPYYNLVEKEENDVGLTANFSTTVLWDDYIKEIFKMYENLTSALNDSTAKNIVLTLPGSGVYSRQSMHAKVIQGICLRMAFEVNPLLMAKAQADQVHLPFPDPVVMAGFHLSKNELIKAYERNPSQAVKDLAQSIDMNELFDRVKTNIPGMEYNSEMVFKK